ncbi:MAG: hypothetical protein ACOYN3_04750 [Acidimicrobiia bacterium]
MDSGTLPGLKAKGWVMKKFVVFVLLVAVGVFVAMKVREANA